MPKVKAPKIKAHYKSRDARGGREWQGMITIDGIMTYSMWYTSRKDAVAWGIAKEVQEQAKLAKMEAANNAVR